MLPYHALAIAKTQKYSAAQQRRSLDWRSSATRCASVAIPPETGRRTDRSATPNVDLEKDLLLVADGRGAEFQEAARSQMG
jgi:hypothetical protein